MSVLEFYRLSISWTLGIHLFNWGLIEHMLKCQVLFWKPGYKQTAGGVCGVVKVTSRWRRQRRSDTAEKAELEGPRAGAPPRGPGPGGDV